MQNRRQHKQAVIAFLQREIANQPWRLSLPRGHGHATYFVRSQERACFIKVGAKVSRYQAMASIGLTPPVLAASHNDICNGNWLVTPAGRVYLIDLESMSLDDPALDIGATLWWYYPPALRAMFLHLSRQAGDPAFAKRMQVRMALHCLNIILPRENSFDRFDPAGFDEALTDFRAIFAGQENPQGYSE